MATTVWFARAPRNASSGGHIRYAKASAEVQWTNITSPNYPVGFECIKEGWIIGSDKYEAYTHHPFIKFPIDDIVASGQLSNAQLHLRIYDGNWNVYNTDAENMYLGVWHRSSYTSGFPWSVTLSDTDYGAGGWAHTNRSSESIFSLIGQARSMERWMGPVNVTSAVSEALAKGWKWVAFRFMFCSQFGIMMDAPSDWNYDNRAAPYDEKLMLNIRGAMSQGSVASPSGFPEPSSDPCPWLQLSFVEGTVPDQWTPGEYNNPTIINKIDADPEAATAIAGTEGGGLWITWSGGVWHKAHERYRPITAVYMDYVRNFVAYPNDQISWFGTASGEVFKSVDSLYTWERYADFEGIVYDIEGSDLDSNKVAVAVGNNIYTTRNGGETWTLSKSHSKNACNLMVRGDEIQAIFEDGNGFRSSNFGSTWNSLIGIPSSSKDVGFNNFNERDSFVGASGQLYVYDMGEANFAYVLGASIDGATNQIDVSHLSSIGLVGTTEKVYKTIDFGHEVHELKTIPAQSVAIGGLVPVPWDPKPSDKPNNVFARIDEVATGWRDRATRYSPRYMYIIRAINGNYYALLESWKLYYSTDNGINWDILSLPDSTHYTSCPWQIDSGLACTNNSGQTISCPPQQGGDTVLIDNNGNIHIIWGVWWRGITWSSPSLMQQRGGKFLLKHTIIDKDHNFISEDTLDHEFTNDRNRRTEGHVLASALDSRGNCAVLYKYRDPQIPISLVRNWATCNHCGYSPPGNPGNDPYLSGRAVTVEEVHPNHGGKCPVCGGSWTVERPWPTTFHILGRSGDIVNLKYAGRTVQIWMHKYSPVWGEGIWYPNTRVTRNTLPIRQCSLVFDSNDVLHLTYTDRHEEVTYYQQVDVFYIEDPAIIPPVPGPDWPPASPVVVAGDVNQYAIVDQYNNIHYIFGNEYKIRFADGVWSNAELSPHNNFNGSFSRSWNGNLWQLLSGNARRRRPLAAPIVDVIHEYLHSFVITSPQFEVSNYSFEEDTGVTGWGFPFVGSRSRSGVRSYHGEYSLRLIGTSGSGGAASIGQTNDWAMPGRTVVLGMMVWCEYSERARIMIGDRASNDSITWDYSSSPHHPGDGEWHYLTVARLIRENTNQIVVVCRVDSGDIVEAFFDWVTVRCINPFYELSLDDKIQVINSEDNNGVYSVVSSVYNEDNEEVTITVGEDIPSDTVLDGEIISVSSSTKICGTWDIFATKSFVDGSLTTLTHSYYPLSYEGQFSSIFADGFAGTIRFNRAVYFWSDPPGDDIKLLEAGNDN